MTARYTLEARIGGGGVAEVFRARRETRSGTAICAVKRLLPQHRDNPAFQTRLLDEHAITRSLRHPNVIEVIELVDIEGIPHLAMEYIDGISIDHLVARGLRGHFIPLRVAATVARDVLEALRYVHGRGVLHRDVSAGNAFLSATGHTKLTDFGAALAPTRLTSTAPGVVLGKAEYLSADRLRGRAATAVDDLFALGIILERMLAACDPRERSSASAAPLRRLREALAGAIGIPENEADQRCRDEASKVSCATVEEITEFFRAPAPSRRSSSAPQSPHVDLDGTTINGQEVVPTAGRHRRQVTHRKV